MQITNALAIAVCLVYVELPLCLCSSFFKFSHVIATAPVQKKRQVWHWGSKMTAYSQAVQFLGVMECWGEQMWCIPCGQ